MKKKVISDINKGECLEEWFNSVAGETLIKQEREWNRDALKKVYGVHLLQIGMAEVNFAEDATELYHPFIMETRRTDKRSLAVLDGDAELLPIATESLSAVILPHILEFSDDPHHLLREVTRVLNEDGDLIIYGFSPWSILTLRNRLNPWRYLSLSVLSDWLTLLGFEIISERQLPLLSRLKIGSYQLVAKRRTHPLTPVRPLWRRQASVLTGGVMNREVVTDE
jgi:SAM-dependent methyltransferase